MIKLLIASVLLISILSAHAVKLSFKRVKPYWDYEDDISYRWNVIEEDIDTFQACRQYRCKRDVQQTVCLPPPKPNNSCYGFELLPSTFDTEKLFVIGHNVLRNRVAKSMLYAKEMNYVVKKVRSVKVKLI